MDIGVLGTGMVGRSVAGGLARAGHRVCMGSRTAGGEKARAWVAEAGGEAREGTFADAAAFGEVAFNCTSGAGSLDALEATGDALDGKVLVDVSNPLAISPGAPPSLFVGITDSLAEQLQRALPSARVVRSLNTVNASVMSDPALLPGDHVMPLCGDDDDAKATVAELLGDLGWPRERLLDLGPLSAARGMEAYVLFWIGAWQALGTPMFNIALAR